MIRPPPRSPFFPTPPLSGFILGTTAFLAFSTFFPTPPLDGSKILMGLLPPAQAVSYARLQPYGTWILILLVFTNVLSYVLIGPMRWLVEQATGSGFFF